MQPRWYSQISVLEFYSRHLMISFHHWMIQLLWPTQPLGDWLHPGFSPHSSLPFPIATFSVCCSILGIFNEAMFFPLFLGEVWCFNSHLLIPWRDRSRLTANITATVDEFYLQGWVEQAIVLYVNYYWLLFLQWNPKSALPLSRTWWTRYRSHGR